jgi:uncharacterized protein (DUF952 family)
VVTGSTKSPQRNGGDSVIYHIARAADWQAAQAIGRYAADTLTTEGFIHCSDEAQVARVANARFAGRSDLVVLTVDPTRLASEVRYEVGDPATGERFPHCYGPIDLAAVVTVTPLVPNADGQFI